MRSGECCDKKKEKCGFTQGTAGLFFSFQSFHHLLNGNNEQLLFYLESAADISEI